METIEVILQGGGEHARVVLDCLLSSSVRVIALFDPKYSGELMGVPQLGIYNPLFAPSANAIVAIGNNRIRKKVAETTHHQFTTAIHHSVLLSKHATVGTGSMLLHGVIVQANSRIGDHVIVNTGAQIDHDVVIENFVHIAPGAILCGTVSVGEGSLIGAGAVILPGKKIGRWAIVGAGTVVKKDVPDGATVVGNPARIIKQVPL